MKDFLKILSFFIAPTLVFVLGLFVLIFGISERIGWIDIPLHLLGGMSIAYLTILFISYFKEKNMMKINRKFILMILIISTVSLFAVLWEFYEYIIQLQGDLPDTMGDFLMGLIGGATVAIFSKV